MQLVERLHFSETCESAEVVQSLERGMMKSLGALCIYQHPQSTFRWRQTSSPCWRVWQGRAQPDPCVPSPGLLHSTRNSSLLWLILQGKLSFWMRFGVLSSCSIQDFFWEAFVAQTAGEKVRSPKWEVSLQSCTKPGSSRLQIHMKMGIRELQLQGRHLRL